MSNIQTAQCLFSNANTPQRRDDWVIDKNLQIQASAQEKIKIENQPVAGIHFLDHAAGRVRMQATLHKLKLNSYTRSYQLNAQCTVFLLKEQYAYQFLPKANTIEFNKTLNFDLQRNLNSVEGEIVLSMLGAPQPLVYSSYDEFVSAVRTRVRIVKSARQTQLTFETSKAERPEDLWVYKEDVGFTVIPGKSLITALETATQPKHPEAPIYSFSCYRATEYVILHAIAQELAVVNPNLLRQLQHLWEVRPIKSGEYHDVFLDEYGSMERQIPTKYYIPGDRVWFRNPDFDSSNVSGYEGSWVIYLGGGLFSNFWKSDRPYTFADKCIEIYHWRHATYQDDEGELRINERIVEELVRNTKSDPDLAMEVVQKMAKPRDPKNVFSNGGCADISREFPKAMCVGTAKIKIPKIE